MWLKRALQINKKIKNSVSGVKLFPRHPVAQEGLVLYVNHKQSYFLTLHEVEEFLGPHKCYFDQDLNTVKGV